MELFSPASLDIPILATLRYMRADDTPDLRALAERAAALLAPALDPRGCCERLPVERRDGKLCIGALCTDSVALARELSGCNEAFVMLFTLGTESDRFLARQALLSPALALALDAAATAAVEQLADMCCAQLADIAAIQGLRLTRRFSPGYGDFSLCCQTALLQTLDAKCLGVTLSASLLMQPAKSVSAVVGLRAADDLEFDGKCADCTMLCCDYRIKPK